MSLPAEILQFWFGNSPDDLQVIEEKSSIWWSKDKDVDEEIRDRFNKALKNLMAGTLTLWKETPRDLLAMIILTDQFSRNIHRGHSASFSQDLFAQSLCQEGLVKKLDLQLRPIERVFFYMPLQHAESLELQRQSVELFRKLLINMSGQYRQKFNTYVDFAVSHHDTIACFGRFPHRNQILGRQSTPEETEFLRQPGSSF
jgi:uncharacterized protein (DUF924 family)